MAIAAFRLIDRLKHKMARFPPNMGIRGMVIMTESAVPTQCTTTAILEALKEVTPEVDGIAALGVMIDTVIAIVVFLGKIPITEIEEATAVAFMGVTARRIDGTE